MKNKQKITAEEVKHIAKLSGLILSEAEVKKFQKQLTTTLSYIEILNIVSTDKIDPTDHVGKSINVFREDEVKPSLSQEEILSNAPETYQGFFKVKAILEEK